MGEAVSTRHTWKYTDSMWNGQAVHRCAHCGTERTRDPSTRTLWLYRGGRAVPPNGKPMPETWTGYIAGRMPKCPGLEVVPC